MAAEVDRLKCQGCASCTLTCPVFAITIQPDGKAEVDVELCISCGTCKQTCEHGAIILENAGGGY